MIMYISLRKKSVKNFEDDLLIMNGLWGDYFSNLKYYANRLKNEDLSKINLHNMRPLIKKIIKDMTSLAKKLKEYPTGEEVRLIIESPYNAMHLHL